MGYPLGTQHDPLAPWNEPDVSHLFVCGGCGNILNKFEECDPCKIDDKTFCDSCSSDLTALRIDGYLDKVSSKTNILVWDSYYKVYDAINFGS